MTIRPKIMILLVLVGALAACGNEFEGSATFRGSGDAAPQLSKTIVQGKVGDRFLQVAEYQEEQFQQNLDQSKLDLLVVVDNSGSMSEEQANLSTKLNPLLSHIADSDWQIAVTTTDESDDCLRPDGLIKAGEADIANRFSAAIAAGTSGDGNEQGILRAVQALSMQGCNNPMPWVRQDSALAVLIVSDEDNCSSSGFGSGCSGEMHRNPAYMTNYLESIRTIGVDARVYGLIWKPGDNSCTTAENQAVTYNSVINSSKGTSGSICEADYTQTLESISEDISVILESRFELQADADPTSLKVFVDGEEVQVEYKVFGNVVSFKEPPPPGSSVVIKYRPLVGEGSNRFKLSREYEGKVIVELDGEFLDPSEYTIDKSTNELVLRTPPPRNAELYIYYGEEEIIRASFLVEPNIRVATIKVYVDEQETDAWDFDNATGILTFNEAPVENAEILVTYAR